MSFVSMQYLQGCHHLANLSRLSPFTDVSSGQEHGRHKVRLPAKQVVRQRDPLIFSVRRILSFQNFIEELKVLKFLIHLNS